MLSGKYLHNLRDIFQANLTSPFSKISRGASAYERNTGIPHPSALPSRKRNAVSESLTDGSEELWYGTIAVGNPAVNFQGTVVALTPRGRNHE
jgi:hypothetical protein